MIHAAEFLAGVSLFSLVKRKDLDRIAGLARHHAFHRGDLIIREGDRDNRLFIIVRGEVEVVKGYGGEKAKPIRTLGPRRYFGEMALIDDLARSASVTALTDTELLSLSQTALRQEIRRQPYIASELLRHLSRRIRAIEKTLMGMVGALLPICVSCKRIRDDEGHWVEIDTYIADHSDTEFSHGICPDCQKKLYPELSSDP